MNRLTLNRPIAASTDEQKATARVSAGAVIAARKAARAIRARPGMDFEDELAAQGLAEVDAMLRRAAVTFVRLPGSAWPAGYRSFWPDVVRSAAESYGAQAAEMPRLIPSATDISLADSVQRLIAGLNERMAKVIVCRMARLPFAVIATRLSISKRTARLEYLAALVLLKQMLAGKSTAA
jgi:hypothetical protein